MAGDNEAGQNPIQDGKLQQLIEYFSGKYPAPRTSLNYRTPFQLLLATILSAQTTDQQVNLVTERLFQEYTRPEDFAALEPGELAPWLKWLGLYRNKSKYIVQASRIILDRYQGNLPETREELMELPGVGRKTANVVLANAFGIPAFAVDTHVFRVAKRLGLASGSTPLEVERGLQAKIPEELWKEFHHWLIFHGREVCRAQNPACQDCQIADICPAYTRKGGE